jgi:antitoxin component of MazEF toxin-antitoxin module
MIKTQKVIKVGNSLAVTLDKKFVQLANIEPGQPLAVVYTPEKGLLSMAKSEKALMVKDQSEKAAYVTGKITPELKEWTDTFLLENEEAMKKLKDL